MKTQPRIDTLFRISAAAALIAAFALPAQTGAAEAERTRRQDRARASQESARTPTAATVAIQRPSAGTLFGGTHRPGGSHGGPGGHEGPGGFETPGGSRDYALLKQIHDPTSHDRWGYALVELDVDKGEVLDEEWDPSWEYSIGTTDNELRQRLTLTWYGQASCASGIGSLKLSGPGGTETQSLAPGQKTVHGKFDYQSFTLATIESLCVDWAEQTPAGWPGAPMVPLYEEFDLVGGMAPASASDQLRLDWQCVGGSPMSSSYQPKIRVRCSRQNL